MSMWWYTAWAEKRGPITEDQLRDLLVRRQINEDTMVWREGMEDWIPLRQTPESVGLLSAVPPPFPVQTESEKLLGHPLAGRWSRYFARLFDLYWECTLLTYVTAAVLANYSTSFVEWIYKPGSSTIYGILSVPFALLLDAVIQRYAGNTPGKALLGLKVTNVRGEKLSLKPLVGRNMRMWLAGLALGLPLIAIFTMAREAKRVAKGQQTSYDEIVGARVHAKPIGTLRRVVFAMCFLVLFVGLAVLRAEEQKMDRAAAAAPSSYIWKNPVTGRKASVNGRWTVESKRNEDGQTYHSFTERSDRALVLFAVEEAPSMEIGEYARSFTTEHRAAMRLTGDKFEQTPDGNTWWAKGTMVNDGSVNVVVHVVQRGHQFWRLVTVWQRPFNFLDPMFSDLGSELWGTVVY